MAPNGTAADASVDPDTANVPPSADTGETRNSLFLPLINTNSLSGAALGSPGGILSVGLVALVLIACAAWLHKRHTVR